LGTGFTCGLHVLISWIGAGWRLLVGEKLIVFNLGVKPCATAVAEEESVALGPAGVAERVAGAVSCFYVDRKSFKALCTYLS